MPSQRFYDPTSSLSSTTASSSSISSFTSYPHPPLPTAVTATYHSTVHHDYYQQPQPWDDHHQQSFAPPPPPPPPPLNQHIIRSHQQRHRWSPESSSHPYQYPYHQTQKQVSPTDSQSPGTRTKERRHRKQPHELLSESQKKANHIASEQKRRQNIRIGFDQLIDIVPTLNHGNRSEALILQKCKSLLYIYM